MPVDVLLATVVVNVSFRFSSSQFFFSVTLLRHTLYYSIRLITLSMDEYQQQTTAVWATVQGLYSRAAPVRKKRWNQLSTQTCTLQGPVWQGPACCGVSLLPPVDGAGSWVSAVDTHLQSIPVAPHLYHVSNQQHQTLIGSELSCRLWKVARMSAQLTSVFFTQSSWDFLCFLWYVSVCFFVSVRTWFSFNAFLCILLCLIFCAPCED